MKSLKCDLCEFSAQGETFDQWFNNMHDHYAQAHADWVEEMRKKPGTKEEGEKWMADSKAKFDAAPNI